jgi:hypothetical protein
MVGDETLIDLDAPERSSWVDELFAQEDPERGRLG